MRMELMSVLLSSKINILRQKSDICFTLLLFSGKSKNLFFFTSNQSKNDSRCAIDY